MNTIRVTIRQAVSGTGFALAIFGTVLALFFSNTSTFLRIFQTWHIQSSQGMFCMVIQESIASDTMQLVLPILSAVPFAAGYYDDLHSGFIKAYLPRTGYRCYILGKLAGCFTSGGMVPVAGILFFSILTGWITQPSVQELMDPFCGIPWILRSGVHLFCAGALWSLIGMTAAAYTNSKPMAYAASFIFFYVLVILSQRYFQSLSLLNPKVWLDPDDRRGIGILLAWSVCTALCFSRSARKRLKSL